MHAYSSRKPRRLRRSCGQTPTSIICVNGFDYPKVPFFWSARKCPTRISSLTIEHRPAVSSYLPIWNSVFAKLPDLPCHRLLHKRRLHGQDTMSLWRIYNGSQPPQSTVSRSGPPATVITDITSVPHSTMTALITIIALRQTSNVRSSCACPSYLRRTWPRPMGRTIRLFVRLFPCRIPFHPLTHLQGSSLTILFMM